MASNFRLVLRLIVLVSGIALLVVALVVLHDARLSGLVVVLGDHRRRVLVLVIFMSLVGDSLLYAVKRVGQGLDLGASAGDRLVLFHVQVSAYHRISGNQSRSERSSMLLTVFFVLFVDLENQFLDAVTGQFVLIVKS